jgi:hypothetical protein
VFPSSMDSSALTLGDRVQRMNCSRLEFWLLESLRIVLWQEVRRAPVEKLLYTGRVTLQRRRVAAGDAGGYRTDLEVVPLRTVPPAAAPSSAAAAAADRTDGVVLQSMSGMSARSLRAAAEAAAREGDSDSGESEAEGDDGGDDGGSATVAKKPRAKPWVPCSPGTCGEVIREPNRRDQVSDSPWSFSRAMAGGHGGSGRGWIMRSFDFNRKLHQLLLELANPHHYE